MTSNSTKYLTLLLFALALIEVVSLFALIPLDAALASWVETQRSCALDQFNARLANWPVISLVTVTVGALVYLSCILQHWNDMWWGVRAILSGMFFSELLKTGLERARPSVLPPFIEGNSFPSGHVVGAVLLAGTLGILLARQRGAIWVKILGMCVLVSFIGVIAGQRVYLARHWLSDILGSVLLASGWLCCTLSYPVVIKISRRTLQVYAAFLVCYQGFYFLPRTRFSLPSVMSVNREPLLDFSFGRLAPQTFLYGAWGEDSSEPAGPITWMWRGEASVEMDLAADQSYLLKLAVRPFLQSKTFACFPLEISVNQRPVSRLLLYRGWREYVLPLDSAWLVPGMNAVTFRVGEDFPDSPSDPRMVAFRHLHLFADGQ